MKKVFKGLNSFCVQLEHRITKEFEQKVIQATDLKQAKNHVGCDFAKEFKILDVIAL